jgi:hypothetical protein
MPWANVPWEKPLPVTAERGFLIPAFNSEHVDYESCAEQLAASIREHHPDAPITILTQADLPQTDVQGQALDWFAYRLSPYRQTIKLEADMIMAGPCLHWFDIMQHLDLCVSTSCRDFYGEPSSCRIYRKTFDDNQLPDVYNAVTYWRVSELARDFFALVRDIFARWNDYRRLLKFADDEATTDVVYAMAVKILGEERCTMPWASYPRITHMKRGVVPIRTQDWTRELIWEADPLRINTVAQWGAVHYHVKSWRI